MEHEYRGSCHCGAIRVRLRLSRPAAQMQVRSCQCGFCIRQGSLTVSDPDGEAVIEAEAGALRRYQFATQTGASLLCARCGVYAGALMEADGRFYSVTNTRGLAMADFTGRTGEKMDYDSETAAGRIARRKQRWTPTLLREG